jgi:hypothetical protein
MKISRKWGTTALKLFKLNKNTKNNNVRKQKDEEN